MTNNNNIETIRNEYLRNEYLRQVALIDIEIMKLTDQMTEVMQKAADIDMKNKGSITDITKKFIETFHFKIDEHGNVFNEHDEYYQEQIKDNEEKTTSASAEPIENNSDKPKSEYAAYVYVKGNSGKKPVRVTGTSPEKIISLCQKWNDKREDDNKLETAYMQKYDFQLERYEHIGKYDIKTGLDITPVYLKLPPMNKQQFKETIEMFKSNGAKYSDKQKAWYITKKQDMSIFKDYIPQSTKDTLDKNKRKIENSEQKVQKEKGKNEPER